MYIFYKSDNNIDVKSNILNPVSYTHLDVYKRQLLVNASNKAATALIINKFNPSLNMSLPII